MIALLCIKHAVVIFFVTFILKAGVLFSQQLTSLFCFLVPYAVLEINFFAGSILATWYKKVAAKVTYPVANIGGLVIAQLPSFVRFMTKHISVWSKALIMPLTISNCVLPYREKNSFSENGHVLRRNYFHNRIPR